MITPSARPALYGAANAALMQFNKVLAFEESEKTASYFYKPQFINYEQKEILMSAVTGDSTDPNVAGVTGTNTVGVGVAGTSNSSDGVRATSTTGNGLSARSTNNVAIFAESANATGIIGIGHAQPGITGESDSNDGVRATSTSGNGLSAFGGGANGVGVFAQSSAKRNKGTNTIAGFFDGDVVVSGDVQLQGADFAEHFDVAACVEAIDPGTVMVIHDDGALYPCHYPYDKRVTGVVSGAGDNKPGIVLDKRPSAFARLPIALVGKVYCMVDAQYGAIHVGDMLTTSPTPGHAMRADDPLKAFGAVIGKALQPLAAGQALVPILIALQ